MWTPDVYEGSPTSVTSFFALVPTIAAISVFIRFMYVPFVNLINQWQTIIVFLSIASMILGAVAAIGQNNLKNRKRILYIFILVIRQNIFFKIFMILNNIIDSIYI